MLLLAAALALFLFMNPEWGDHLDVAMSTFLAVLAIVISILLGQGARPFAPGSRLDASVPAGATLSRRARLLLIAFTFVVVLATVSIVYVTKREPDPFQRMRGHVRIGYVAADQGGLSTPNAASGTQDGFEAVVANSLMEHFPDMAQPEWVPLETWDERLTALEGRWGEDQPPVDLVLSTFSITGPRRARIDFAGPYFRDVQALVAIKPEVDDLPNLKFNRVCTPDGTTGQRRLQAYGWDPQPSKSLQKCFALLLDDKVDAVSTDSVILSGYLADHPIRGAKLHRPFLGSTEEYGVGIPNNSPRLCREISAALDKFLETSWDAAYEIHLVPRGLTMSDLPNHRPRGTEACEEPGSWYAR